MSVKCNKIYFEKRIITKSKLKRRQQRYQCRKIASKETQFVVKKIMVVMVWVVVVAVVGAVVLDVVGVVVIVVIV